MLSLYLTLHMSHGATYTIPALVDKHPMQHEIDSRAYFPLQPSEFV